MLVQSALAVLLISLLFCHGTETYDCYICAPCVRVAYHRCGIPVKPCPICVYNELLSGGVVTQVSRVCLNEGCTSYDRVLEGTGERRVCCKGRFCNRTYQTAKENEI